MEWNNALPGYRNIVSFGIKFHNPSRQYKSNPNAAVEALKLGYFSKEL
jgi:hypothetical protein